MSRSVAENEEREAPPKDAVGPKISFGSWAFSFGPYADDPWSFQKVCSFVAEAGYDGIEINGFRPHPHADDFDSDLKCRKLRSQIDSFGLGVSGFAPDMTPAPPAVSSGPSYLRLIDSSRAFCERMGIQTLRVDSVSPPGPLSPVEYEERFARLANTFRSSAERCQRSGITLVWEFEPGFWLNKPSEVMRLIETVDHPNFQILFDTSHALTSARGRRQEEPVELLEGGVEAYARMLAPYVGHLHVIDSVGELHDDETSEHLPFGAGEVDFDATIAALGRVAQQLPWWTVDYCFWPRTDVDGALAVPLVRDLIARSADA